MIKKTRRSRSAKSKEIHEHLAFTLQKTSYADRLMWLQQANDFVRLLQKNKKYPNLPKKH